MSDDVEVLTSTDTALYEEYNEVKEKVKAFQFEGPHQVRAVLKAFGVPDNNWTLNCRKNSYTLTFPAPAKPKTEVHGNTMVTTGTITLVPALIQSGAWYDGHGNVALDAITVWQDAWIVERWSGTEHAEMHVMTDKDFRRKYR